VLITAGSSSVALIMQDQPAAPAGPVTRVPGQAAQPGNGNGTALVPGDPTAAGAAAPARGAGGPDFFMFAILGLFAFMIISMMLSGRKQRRQIQDMLASLTRGDTVQTTGGVIGVIGEIRDDLIVLKIDETNGTKMKVTKTSIARVVKPSRERGNDDRSDVVDHKAA
jgi:preprotein translocase subunit YajC